MWIARDKDGTIWLFTQKPIRSAECFFTKANYYELDSTILERCLGVTNLNWKNSPIEVDFKVK